MPHPLPGLLSTHAWLPTGGRHCSSRDVLSVALWLLVGTWAAQQTYPGCRGGCEHPQHPWALIWDSPTHTPCDPTSASSGPGQCPLPWPW